MEERLQCLKCSLMVQLSMKMEACNCFQFNLWWSEDWQGQFHRLTTWLPWAVISSVIYWSISMAQLWLVQPMLVQYSVQSQEERLWENVCSSMWPSTNWEDVKSSISSIGGFRKFYADCFPLMVNKEVPESQWNDYLEYSEEGSDTEYSDDLDGFESISSSNFVSIVDTSQCIFVGFPTGMHMDTWLDGGDHYWKTIQFFFKRNVPEMNQAWEVETSGYLHSLEEFQELPHKAKQVMQPYQLHIKRLIGHGVEFFICLHMYHLGSFICWAIH